MRFAHLSRAVLVAGFSLLMVGCASVGNENLRSETQNTVSEKIVEGQTTKDQVRAIYGAPDKTSFTDSGLEIWNYTFANVSVDAVSLIPIVSWFGSSASGTKKELVVLFDENDIVRRFTMSEADVRRRTGIFNN